MSAALKNNFYIPDSNGVVHHYLTGYLVPWNQKDGLKKDNAIPFEMKQGAQIMIYLKTTICYNFISSSLIFWLWNTEKLQQHDFQDYERNYYESAGFLDTFFAGVFLLAAIFNFLIFLGVREKVYLYFSLMLVCFSLNDFNGSFHPLILDYPTISTLLWWVSNLWYFFLLQFIRHYFRISNFYRVGIKYY
ncbi:MAG: 7TM diverse intracellular signaling domain-containing protein [Ginsengibacter sp.]